MKQKVIKLKGYIKKSQFYLEVSIPLYQVGFDYRSRASRFVCIKKYKKLLPHATVGRAKQI